MRKIAIITATAFGAAGLALGAAPAGAATRAGDGNQEFCEELANVDTGDFNTNPNATFDPDSAEAVADSMRRAAKLAPKKVKKAMRRVAKVYDRIADEEDFSEAFANERFLRDSLTYSTYYLETCANITIPTN